MKTLIQVRGVDESTRDELVARASKRGQSLTAFVRDILNAEVANPDLLDLFTEIRDRDANALPPSAEFVRRGRDGAAW